MPVVRSRVPSPSPRVRVSEMQRARLLAAAVVSIAELGYAGASVAHITARARVSRRTFYDLFASREECLLAVLQGAVTQVSGEIAIADLARLGWRERVREGLLVILSFFDREPVLARVCVVQALQGGPRVLAWREDLLGVLAGVVDEGRGESSRTQRAPVVLTAEGLVGAAFAIVYARLLRGERREPLRDLVGELMSMIVLPYLGPVAARREQRGIGTFSSGREQPAGLKSPTRLAYTSSDDPLRDLPMRLTYRTARVLQAVARHPGSSNRTIGELADIHDQGQVSKLLARLARIGLLANSGAGPSKGEANAWRLTGLGERVAQQLSLNIEQEQSEQQSTHLEGSE